MTERIVVTIPALKPPVIDAQGFSGNSCELATKPIEEALGGHGDNKTVVTKPEFHETSTEQTEELHQTW